MITPPEPAEGEEPDLAPAPLNLWGTFAFVTTSQGNVYIVNVDDDIYPDFEDPADPSAVDITLALPHQIRDRGQQRDSIRTSCGAPATDQTVLGPRVDTQPNIFFSSLVVAEEKRGILPSIRQIACEYEGAVTPASELSFLAPVEDRELAFPD